MREDKRSTGSLTDITDDVVAEILKPPEYKEILFNCIRKVKK